MNLIVAVDENWAIGYNNELLVSIPDDMKFLEKQQQARLLLWEEKTLESFSGRTSIKEQSEYCYY